MGQCVEGFRAVVVNGDQPGPDELGHRTRGGIECNIACPGEFCERDGTFEDGQGLDDTHRAWTEADEPLGHAVSQAFGYLS